MLPTDALPGEASSDLLGLDSTAQQTASPPVAGGGKVRRYQRALVRIAPGSSRTGQGGLPTLQTPCGCDLADCLGAGFDGLVASVGRMR